MKNFVCSICNQDTSNVDTDYLVGADHLSCVLKNEKANQVEICVLCGAETPYKFYEHVDMRNGYIDGCGQLCEKCYNKGVDHEQILVPAILIKQLSNDAELGAKIRQLYWESK